MCSATSPASGSIRCVTKPKPVARRLAPESRRKAILGAAIELFGSRGYANVSTTDIARKAGVTPALVHHYFGPKRNIYLVILAEWQRLTVASLNVDRALPYRTRLLRTATSWLAQISRYPALWMATGGQGESSDDSEVAAIQEATRSGAVDMLISKFDDVVADTPVARWAVRGFTGFHDMLMWAHLRGEIDAKTTAALLAEGLSATFKSIIPAVEGDGGKRQRKTRAPSTRR